MTMATPERPDPRCVRCGHRRSDHSALGVIAQDGARLFCLPQYPAPGVSCGCSGFHDGNPDPVEQWAKDLYLATETRADHWNAQLLRLIMKSDPEHLARLRIAFPVAVRAVEEWKAAPTSMDFFRAYGVKR